MGKMPALVRARRRRLVVASAVGLALLLTGCAGGSEVDPVVSDSGSTDTTQTDPAPEPDASSTDDASGADAGYTVCRDYFEAQLNASSALSPKEVDPAAASTVDGVTLPAAGCAMQITLGNGTTQLSLGWDDADVEAFHGAFLAAGYVDASPFANATGSSYVMSRPGSTASVTLWSGDRVYAQVGPRGVYLGASQ